MFYLVLFYKLLITNECGTVFGRQGPEFTKSPGAILDRRATRRVAGRTPAIKSSHPDQFSSYLFGGRSLG